MDKADQGTLEYRLQENCRMDASVDGSPKDSFNQRISFLIMGK